MEKKGSKKQLIFQKWNNFDNWQNWPPSKDYSPFKIVTLGQKLKMQKNIPKTFLQDIAVVLCKHNSQKQLYYPKNGTISKIGKSGHQAKAIAFAKSELWVKN